MKHTCLVGCLILIIIPIFIELYRVDEIRFKEFKEPTPPTLKDVRNDIATKDYKEKESTTKKLLLEEHSKVIEEIKIRKGSIENMVLF